MSNKKFYRYQDSFYIAKMLQMQTDAGTGRRVHDPREKGPQVIMVVD
jgi:hypothetical protein